MRALVSGVLAVAFGTALEAVRSRLLLVSLFFAVALVAISVAAASVSFEEQARLILDVGMAAASALGSLIAIAVAIASFANELTRRTAYTLLARPIHRWAFLLGKYLGIVAVMEVTVLLMGTATAVTTMLYGADLPAAFVPGVWLCGVEVAVVVAVTLLFSTMTVPVLAATYSVAIVLVGNLANELLRLALQLEGKGAPLGYGLHLLYYLPPNLANLSLRTQVANALPVPTGFLAWGTAYGLAYGLAALVLGMWVFSRRKTV